MKFAVIGAGLAGLTCAEGLRSAGHEVALFDKGHGAGGRMASRRVQTTRGEAGFDYGAQYMTARDPAFAAQLAEWARQGLAALWPAAGEAAWVGVPSMNAPLRRMAAELGVRRETPIEALEADGNGWRLRGEGPGIGDGEARYDGVVVALPAEQAGALLAPVAADMARRALATRSTPCWTMMAAFADPLPIEGDVLRDRGPIGWAARNSAKPGRPALETWVVQATPDWSVAHLEDAPAEVMEAMKEILAHEVGAPLVGRLFVSVHRWRYARSGGSGDGMLWDPARRLGVCGDWLLGPRVECAFLSGRLLATAILAGAGAASAMR